MSYVLPQVLVFQDVTPLVQAVLRPLRAMVFGPHYDLKTYVSGGDNGAIRLGAYDNSQETCYPWPGRPAGGIVDQDWTQLFMDDAWLQYWNNSGQIRKVSGYTNKIRATTVNFVGYKTWARDVSLRERDVQLGDGVRVRGGSADIETYVTGFEHDTVASSVGASAADVDNQIATLFNESINQTVGPFNNVEGAVDGSLYDGLEDGVIEETYTVEVIQGSTGGDATTARLRVVSASGTDNDSNVVPAAFGVATAIGTRGLVVTFDTTGGSSSSSSSGGGSTSSNDFLAGQKWSVSVRQAFTPLTSASAGTFAGPQDTTYIVTVAKGGGYADNPTIMVTTTNGVDAGGPYIVTGAGDQIQVGNYGVKISFTGGTGLLKGDRYLITAVAEQPGAIRTLILANALPAAMDGIDLAVDLFIRKDLSVTRNRIGYAPLTNFETSATEICVEAGIVGYDSSWVDSSGTLLAMAVYKGDMFVQYRSLLQTYATHVFTISDVSDVASTLGTISRDNPLALGVYKALENANGTDVKYMSVPSNDLTGYSFVLAQLVGRNDVYGLVPLTWDRAVQNLVAAHVDAMSSPENGRWRIGWFNSEAVEEKGIATEDSEGNPILATVTDPDAGSNYTYVYWDGGTFLTDGVRAGDVFRANFQSDGFGAWTYEEYIVDQVISEDSLRLMSGPSAAINVPSKFEVWRNLDKDEIAQEFAMISGSFGQKRVRHVWPDWITSAGTTMEGFYLCCSLAGLRSGVAPHQGMTNLEIAGYDSVERSTDFFGGAQLNTMAAAGTWIVTQDTDTGQVYTRQQLTTADYDNLNEREDTLVTNLDSISYYVLDAFASYIGKSNISDSFMAQLETDLGARLTELKAETTVNLGPQILGWTITEFRQHSLLKDRVVARVNLDLPYPFNNFEVHLVI